MSKTTGAVVEAGPDGRVATLCAVARAMGFGDGALRGIAASAAGDGWVPLPVAARMLHVSRETLHRWCAAGAVPKRPGVGRAGSMVELVAVAAAASRSRGGGGH